MLQVCSSDPAHHPLPFIALSRSRSSAPRNFSGRFFPPDKLSSNCRQFSSKNCHQLSRISCHHFKRNFFTFLTNIQQPKQHKSKPCFKSRISGAVSPPPRSVRVFGALQLNLLPQVDPSFSQYLALGRIISCRRRRGLPPSQTFALVEFLCDQVLLLRGRDGDDT